MSCKVEIKSTSLETIFYKSVKEIPEKVWEELSCTGNVYFDPLYLKALEAHNSQISFYYTVIFDEEKHPIAFATIQIVDFYLDAIRNDLEMMVRRIKNIGRKLGIIPYKKPFRVLTCGNTFVSGEHGIYIQNYKHKNRLIKYLGKEILHFVNADAKLKNEISAFMLKDFVNDSLSITDELLDYNYSAFNVEPNMVMQINPEWNNFDDYLSAVKTKFRVKAKKALKVSSDLQVEDVTLDNIEKVLPNMTTLYKTVSSKAGFNLGDFNLETYISLKKNLKDNYILKTYSVNNALVGFLSGVINNNELDAHFVGIDYSKNREYAIYQRMLYDYIQIALDNKLSVINFGRTASEIKSSVGATPQDLTIYLRHKKSIPNRLLKIFLKKIEPTPFNQKQPFKHIKEKVS